MTQERSNLFALYIAFDHYIFASWMSIVSCSRVNQHQRNIVKIIFISTIHDCDPILFSVFVVSLIISLQPPPLFIKVHMTIFF